MFTPTVQLRSGGYIVINQTEALVAIDVNSGRATREHHIEDTATKTNCEAAEEVARQLRLRDLAGLIVIDFIDMDEHRNNRTVERRLKDALKNDRARIQVGRISHFGLMEMSRQRIRSSVLESSTDKCPHCGGTGHVRSVSSVTLHMLRMIEEMLLKGATHNIVVRTRSEVALYVLNHKRAHLRDLESRFQITITVNADASVGAAQPFLIEKGEQVHSVEAAKALVAQQQPAAARRADEEDEFEDVAEDEAEEAEAEGERGSRRRRRDRGGRRIGRAAEAPGENGQRRGRRRRRRGRGGRGARAARRRTWRRRAAAACRAAGRQVRTAKTPWKRMRARKDNTTAEAGRAGGQNGRPAQPGGERDGDGRRRRRGRRGGRRNRRGREGEPGYAGANGGQDGHHEGQEEQQHESRSTSSRMASSRKWRTPSPILADRRARKRRSRPPCTRRSRSSRSRATRRRCSRAVHVGRAAEAPLDRARAGADVFLRRDERRAAGSREGSAARARPEPLPPRPNRLLRREAKPRRFGWWSKRG